MDIALMLRKSGIRVQVARAGAVAVDAAWDELLDSYETKPASKKVDGEWVTLFSRGRSLVLRVDMSKQGSHVADLTWTVHQTAPGVYSAERDYTATFQGVTAFPRPLPMLTLRITNDDVDALELKLAQAIVADKARTLSAAKAAKTPRR